MVTEHDRYLIYDLLGHRVKVEQRGRRNGKGVVEKVTRNIFDDVVEVTISGFQHDFREPEMIVRQDGAIVFMYGSDFDPSDDALFQSVRDAGMGENVDDVLARIEPAPASCVMFHIGESVRRRCIR